VPTRAASGAIRADLQGLRAVAVALVVLFHLWPTLVPGGYVGVDVFFAISGFLITAHLLRELEDSGTIRLGRFWARRARRLLPAALTVLLATLVACWLFAPIGDLPRFLRETAWSALYIENWALAGSAVDYLAAEAAPSPVQHYWSLSVEEQFYLVWPLLMLAGAWLAARTTRRSTGPAAGPAAGTAVVLAILFLGSVVWSVVYTEADPSPAYFATTTRAWEFAAGGLLALVTRGPSGALARGGPAVRITVAWLGFACIVVAAFGFSDATPFPSLTAGLPVVGALAVIWASAPQATGSPTSLLVVRPVQWLGDRSYSVYLWHWPVLVVASFVLGRSADLVERLVVLTVTLVLTEATTRWVERPVRFGAPSRWRPARVLGLTAAAMTVVLLAAGMALPTAEARIVAEQVRIERLVATPPACFGAAELLDADSCDAGAVTADDPDASVADAPPERCITDIREAAFEVCEYGAEEDAAARTVALIGDSHAEQWLPAFVAAAESGGWRLLVVAKSSCPFSDAERTEPALSDEVLAQMRKGCLAWNEAALGLLASDRDIDTIVLAARARNPVAAPAGDRWQDVAAAAYVERWAEVPASVQHIVVLRDTPTMAADVLTCVRDEPTPETDCARDRDDALVEDPQYDAALESDDPRVSPVDLTDALCSADACSPVIGDLLAYRDSHHLSWFYAATLGPTIEGVLERLPESTSVAEGR